MRPAGKAIVKKPAAQSSSLSAEVHQQIMDYYKVAEKSKYPEIRAHALKMAKDIGGFQRSQGARLSPTLVTVLATVIVAVAASLSLYFFLHYAERLATELTGLLFLFVLIIIALYTRLSGHLSETNFVRIIVSVVNRIKSMWPRSSSGQINRLEAQDGDSSGSDDPPPPKEE